MPSGKTNDHIRELWVNAIRYSKGDTEWVPKHMPILVCSRHFEDHCYKPTMKDPNRLRLLQNAVPTLFLRPEDGGPPIGGIPPIKLNHSPLVSPSPPKLYPQRRMQDFTNEFDSETHHSEEGTTLKFHSS